MKLAQVRQQPVDLLPFHPGLSRAQSEVPFRVQDDSRETTYAGRAGGAD